MHSFRSKIVVWHLVIAAVTGVCVAALAAWLVFAGISWNARQSLSAAALIVPDIVNLYEGPDGSLARAAPAITAHFRETGIDAFVLAGDSTALRPLAGPFGPPGFSARTGGGPPRRGLLDAIFMSIPPQRVAVRGGMVVLGVDPGRYRLLAIWFGLAALGVFVLVLATTWFIAVSAARSALEPLLRTTEALDRFGDGHFTPEPVRTDDRSELGNLARAYNRAVAEITRAFDERLEIEAEMRRFVADAGHQLRTPLTVIMGHLSAFSFRPNDPRSAAAFDNMLQESRRMRELIEDLIVLAKLDERDDAGEVTDVADVVRRLVDGYTSGPKARRVRSIAIEDASVAGREGEIYGALDALVDNALKYGDRTPVDVSVFREGRDVVVTVADRGPGLPPGDIEHAFERFYRGQTGEGVEGSGLGLSIVARVVERAGGTVALRNRAGGGLAAEIRLPRCEPDSQNTENPESHLSKRADKDEAHPRRGGSMSSISGIFGSNANSYATSINNTLATAANTQQASGPFSNLNLTTTQQNQIQQILQNAQTQGLTQQQAQAQINAVLTPAQQATLQQDLQGQHHHHRHGGGGGGGAASSIGNDDTDEFGIPTTLASASTASAGTISNIAASYQVQSQLQNTGD
jgi:signal transduction histidine kinase/Spy/CpxP family protein refolding chaperone